MCALRVLRPPIFGIDYWWASQRSPPDPRVYVLIVYSLWSAYGCTCSRATANDNSDMFMRSQTNKGMKRGKKRPVLNYLQCS
jgi:hypothetical protein